MLKYAPHSRELVCCCRGKLFLSQGLNLSAARPLPPPRAWESLPRRYNSALEQMKVGRVFYFSPMHEGNCAYSARAVCLFPLLGKKIERLILWCHFLDRRFWSAGGVRVLCIIYARRDFIVIFWWWISGGCEYSFVNAECTMRKFSLYDLALLINIRHLKKVLVLTEIALMEFLFEKRIF